MPDPGPAHGWHGRDLVLNLRVQPRAPRDEFAGLTGNRLKLRITAAPVDGKANGHLIRFLAGIFRVPRSQVEIEAGVTGRDKRVRIREPRSLPDLFRRP